MPLSYREPAQQGCSFCGRPAGEARGIATGDGVGICDDCVALAHELFAQQGVRPARRADDRSPHDRASGWLTSAHGAEPGDGVVVIDLTTEPELELDPADSADVRWPEVGRFPGP